MKLNQVASKLVSQLYEYAIVDQSAESIRDLASVWQCSLKTAHDRILVELRSGRVEKVWKRDPNCRRLVPAYRLKKPATSAAAR